MLTPKNKEIDAGEEVVYTCLTDVTTETPTWEINNIPYLACDLPLGYKANRMKITFDAYENTTLRCSYLDYDNDRFLHASSEKSILSVHPRSNIILHN